jgi:hypothetical protein
MYETLIFLCVQTVLVFGFAYQGQEKPISNEKCKWSIFRISIDEPDAAVYASTSARKSKRKIVTQKKKIVQTQSTRKSRRIIQDEDDDCMIVDHFTNSNSNSTSKSTSIPSSQASAPNTSITTSRVLVNEFETQVASIDDAINILRSKQLTQEMVNTSGEGTQQNVPKTKKGKNATTQRTEQLG